MPETATAPIHPVGLTRSISSMLILELREQELCAQAVDELVVKLRHEIEQGTSISTIGVCLSKVVDSACAEFAHAMNLIHDECDYKPPVARERTSDNGAQYS